MNPPFRSLPPTLVVIVVLVEGAPLEEALRTLTRQSEAESARAVIGLPHPSGRAAMRMLENEGFAFENYIDIFDGGPTMTARTDAIASIQNARDCTLVRLAEGGTRRQVARDVEAEPPLGSRRGGGRPVAGFGRELGAPPAPRGACEASPTPAP